jgi:hypothetical protein
MAHIGKKKQIQSLRETIKRVREDAYRDIKRNRGSPRAPVSIDPQDVIVALKYIGDSGNGDQCIANKLCVSPATLYRWLADKTAPHNAHWYRLRISLDGLDIFNFVKMAP